MTIKTIAFIGTGVMGSSMASHLIKAGFNLNVHNRTKKKAESLIAMGASFFDNVKDCVTDADLIISIVGYPKDVEQVWLQEDGILQNAKKGAIAVDMTTSTPDLAKKLYEVGKEKGIIVADCPVTGGDIGARNATLTMLFGGDEACFEALKEPFSHIGKTFVRFGNAGSGQYTKAVNQIAIAAGMMSVCEAIITAQKCGLDASLVIDTLGKGAAGSFSLTSYGPRILKGDFNPGFFIKHFVKDMKIALDIAKSLNLELKGLSLACELYSLLESKGLGELGTQALYKYYSKDY